MIGDHAFAGGADVLHVFDVALVAERAEPLADHHFGKADDGVERRAHLVADPRQHVGLGVGGALGQPPRLAQFALGLLGLRQIAEHREEIRPVGARASHRHRQRDDAALALAAQHVAAVIEQAGDAGDFDAGEIVEHRVPAFRREQVGEIAPRQFVAVMAEQRFGAAVGRIDIALGVEHHDAFGRGVEDGAEFFGIGVADRRRFGDGRFGSSRGSATGLACAIAAATAAPRGACPRRSAPARNRRPRKSCRGGRRRPRRRMRRPKAGSRKSSPACRCPRSRRRWRRRVRHRARRGRRHPPARAGSHNPSASERPGWHRAGGRAGRSGCRPAADRAAPCRAGLRRARAAPMAPAIPACSAAGASLGPSCIVRGSGLLDDGLVDAGDVGVASAPSRCRAAPTIAARVR